MRNETMSIGGLSKVASPYAAVTGALRRAALALAAMSLVAACSIAPSELVPESERSWSNVDVGAVGAPGSVDVSGAADDVVVVASGDDIWGERDAFHYMYVPVSGDVDVRAIVDRVEAEDAWAKAGVMIRDGLQDDAAHALLSLAPTGTAEFIRRSEPGGDSASEIRPETGLRSWLRLVRRGDEVVAFTSSDGERWSEMGRRTVRFGEEALVGIAATSRHPERRVTAEVRSVAVLHTDGSRAAPSLGDDPIAAPAPAPLPGPRPTPIPGVGDWVCPAAPLVPGHEPTLFVSTTGSDVNDGRSVDRPLRSLGAAAARVGPGDVVWVRGGVYGSNVEFTRSGTPEAPIVFESHPGECAVIDGTSASGYQRIAFASVRHMVFRNFEVRNSPAEGIWLNGSSDVTIEHVRIHGSYYSGITNVGGSGNLFRYIVSHDNVDVANGGDADGISLSSGDGHRIDRCLVYANSDDGVDTWRSTNSVVENCVAFGNGRLGGDGNGFKAGGASETVNTVVRNSVAFDNRANGFDDNSGVNVRFDNNTSFRNGRYGFVAGDGTLRNNLAFGNAGSDWAGAGYRNDEVTNSWNVGVGSSAVLSTVVDETTFLALRPDGAAVDVGTPIGLSYTGPAPDLGALPNDATIASHLGITLGEGSLP